RRRRELHSRKGAGAGEPSPAIGFREWGRRRRRRPITPAKSPMGTSVPNELPVLPTLHAQPLPPAVPEPPAPVTFEPPVPVVPVPPVPVVPVPPVPVVPVPPVPVVPPAPVPV